MNYKMLKYIFTNLRNKQQRLTLNTLYSILYCLTGVDIEKYIPGFFLVTKIRFGYVNNIFGGILSELSEMFVLRQHTQKVLPLQRQVDPYIIQLRSYFTAQELSKYLLVSEINQRLSQQVIPYLFGYLLNIQIMSDKMVKFHILDEDMMSALTIDYSYNHEDSLRNLKIGTLYKFQQLYRQNRPLVNELKSGDQYPPVSLNKQLAIDLSEFDHINQVYRSLSNQYKFKPFQNINDINQYTVDRKARKFKIDTIKMQHLASTYFCQKCHKGNLTKSKDFINYDVDQEDIMFECNMCNEISNKQEAKYEIFAIMLVQIDNQDAYLRIKDQVVFQFFGFTEYYIKFIQDYTLKQQKSLIIRSDTPNQIQQLQEIINLCYKTHHQREIIAQPFCDFVKTAKTKEKFLFLTNKRKKRDQLNEECNPFNYFEWFAPSEYDKLLVYPNGALEVDEKTLEMKKIVCLDCLATSRIEQGNYFEHLKYQLQS
ncbi:hypothetical protein pb186bvf_013258 [Paramecium bursaria]